MHNGHIEDKHHFIQEEVVSVLLYQLAQWMEERSILQNALRNDSVADRGLLQAQMDELEQQLWGQAERWRNAIHELPYASQAYEAPNLDADVSL
jgi:hypothetical protein